ncbi:hypothetical protein [Microbacterium testaceum]|uniref:hypothetical protein n=1 Tax=Microbacterium testaceum TaxID=2033 RepID=UPI0022E633A8|nr:hypothetical protein [Microbacterium testaceum]
MMRLPREVALLGIVVAASVASGCSQLPFYDESFKTEIPAALEAADLGITATWADVGLSGFVETLYVGGTLETATTGGNSARPELVARIISVVLNTDPPPSSYLRISLRDAHSDLIDLDASWEELGVEPRSDGSVSIDDAREVTRESGE